MLNFEASLNVSLRLFFIHSFSPFSGRTKHGTSIEEAKRQEVDIESTVNELRLKEVL